MNNTSTEERSSLTQFILDKLFQFQELTLAAVLPRNRAEARIWREALGLADSYNFSPRTFSAILSRLKCQGLVIKSGGHRKSLWSLTKEGKSKFKSLQTPRLQHLKTDGISRLVMFDIPESEKVKRNWIRIALIACNFKQLQKSVWLGHNPLPEKFIKSLDDFKLKNKVHIVSINECGTLEL